MATMISTAVDRSDVSENTWWTYLIMDHEKGEPYGWSHGFAVEKKGSYTDKYIWSNLYRTLEDKGGDPTDLPLQWYSEPDESLGFHVSEAMVPLDFIINEGGLDE